MRRLLDAIYRWLHDPRYLGFWGIRVPEDVFNLARQIDAACDEIVGALPEVFPQCDCDICREKGDA